MKESTAAGFELFLLLLLLCSRAHSEYKLKKYHYLYIFSILIHRYFFFSLLLLLRNNYNKETKSFHGKPYCCKWMGFIMLQWSWLWFQQNKFNFKSQRWDSPKSVGVGLQKLPGKYIEAMWVTDVEFIWKVVSHVIKNCRKKFSMEMACKQF